MALVARKDRFEDGNLIRRAIFIFLPAHSYSILAIFLCYHRHIDRMFCFQGKLDIMHLTTCFPGISLLPLWMGCELSFSERDWICFFTSVCPSHDIYSGLAVPGFETMTFVRCQRENSNEKLCFRSNLASSLWHHIRPIMRGAASFQKRRRIVRSFHCCNNKAIQSTR